MSITTTTNAWLAICTRHTLANILSAFLAVGKTTSDLVHYLCHVFLLMYLQKYLKMDHGFFLSYILKVSFPAFDEQCLHRGNDNTHEFGIRIGDTTINLAT